MKCPKCDATMSHHYCESWVTTDDEYEPVDYVTLKGYWSCASCSQTIDEHDDEYELPEDA